MRLTSCGFNDSPNQAGSELLVHAGPTLSVDIGFEPTFKPDLSNGHPNLGINGVHALVDTGATQSCIDSQLAATLSLPIVDQAKISGVSGAQTVNMHLAQIHIPSLDITLFGQFAGVDLAAGGQSHSALIGRTFLRHFKMVYDGTTGEVVICEPAAFDMPQFDFDSAEDSSG